MLKFFNLLTSYTNQSIENAGVAFVKEANKRK